MRIQLTRLTNQAIHADEVLLLLLLGSLGFNVYFGVERARIGRAIVASDLKPLLKIGTQAPVFEARDLQDSPVLLTYGTDKRDTLLYVFSPTCQWCDRNLANIKAIIKTRPDLRVVGVLIGNDVKQFAATEITEPFELIVRPTSATIKAYALKGTPTTILVSPQGKVIKAWGGAYQGQLAREVSELLGVDLPGLVEQPLARAKGGSD